MVGVENVLVDGKLWSLWVRVILGLHHLVLVPGYSRQEVWGPKNPISFSVYTRLLVPKSGKNMNRSMTPASLCCPSYKITRSVCVTQKRLIGTNGASQRYFKSEGKFWWGRRRGLDQRVRRVSKHAELNIWKSKNRGRSTSQKGTVRTQRWIGMDPVSREMWLGNKIIGKLSLERYNLLPGRRPCHLLESTILWNYCQRRS